MDSKRLFVVAGMGYILLSEARVTQGFAHPAGWYSSSDGWNEVMAQQLERANRAATIDDGRAHLVPPLVGAGLLCGLDAQVTTADRGPTLA